MVAWAISLCGFIIFLMAYRLEALGLERVRRGVSARVGVTGTRGKSSVTRLIAAALRGSGRRVVAKTTGSRPMLIRADGSEYLVDRPGPACIIEQKKLLALAASERADAFVAEIMSIRPENQAVESARILDINLCVVTNVRVDHAEEQGSSVEEVAECLAASVPRGGILVCPDGEDLPPLRAAALRMGATIRLAPRRLPDDLRYLARDLGYDEFEENLALALEACRALGLGDEAALRSMGGATPDLGALRSWTWSHGPGGAQARFVNAFAANDIESSLAVMDRALLPAAGSDDVAGEAVVGILNLRLDRPERTAQWISAVRGGKLDRMSALYIIGVHAGLAVRRLQNSAPRCVAAAGRDPGRLLSCILDGRTGPVTIVGLGNIAGPGVAIVEHCRSLGLAPGRAATGALSAKGERAEHES